MTGLWHALDKSSVLKKTARRYAYLARLVRSGCSGGSGSAAVRTAQPTPGRARDRTARWTGTAPPYRCSRLLGGAELQLGAPPACVASTSGRHSLAASSVPSFTETTVPARPRSLAQGQARRRHQEEAARNGLSTPPSVRGTTRSVGQGLVGELAREHLPSTLCSTDRQDEAIPGPLRGRRRLKARGAPPRHGQRGSRPAAPLIALPLFASAKPLGWLPHRDMPRRARLPSRRSCLCLRPSGSRI